MEGLAQSPLLQYLRVPDDWSQSYLSPSKTKQSVVHLPPRYGIILPKTPFLCWVPANLSPFPKVLIWRHLWASRVVGTWNKTDVNKSVKLSIIIPQKKPHRNQSGWSNRFTTYNRTAVQHVLCCSLINGVINNQHVVHRQKRARASCVWTVITGVHWRFSRCIWVVSFCMWDVLSAVYMHMHHVYCYQRSSQDCFLKIILLFYLCIYSAPIPFPSYLKHHEFAPLTSVARTVWKVKILEFFFSLQSSKKAVQFLQTVLRLRQ